MKRTIQPRLVAMGLILGAVGLALTLPVMAVAAIAAPAATGQVQGDVKDALGRPLAGVGVRLMAPTGQVIAETRSEATGRFDFTDVPAGTYALTAEKSQFQAGTAIVTVAPHGTATTTLTLASQEALSLKVVARRLARARTGLRVETGSSVTRISHQAIKALPQGDKTPLNQVLLQAPGVVQDAFGQIHVRGDHGNVQYRLNGLILPEGISGFGDTLDTRFADHMSLLTGALPAQYGYRTAGVVDIQTKEGAFQPGGRLDLYGGSHGDLEPSLQYGGSSGAFDYYVDGSYIQNNLGIGNPTPEPEAIHDFTRQANGFGYFSYLLNPDLKASLILGSSVQTFQVPNVPGTVPAFGLNGVAAFPSENLDEHYNPTNQYGILALQGTNGDKLDYQLSLFTRYSGLQYLPDPNGGDLIYRGVESTVNRSSLSGGMQGDGSYRLTSTHTLRFGTFASDELAGINDLARAFPIDPTSGATGSVPTPPIVDNNSLSAQLYGVYAQDEWKATNQLTINYGLRFDDIEGFISSNQLSPRLGAVFTVTPETTLHAGYSRYFTPPSTELISTRTLGLFQNTTNAPSSLTNSPVLPERDNYYDLGVTHQVTPALSVGLDGYYKDATDVQDEGAFGNIPVYSEFNYAHGTVYGTELTTNYQQGDFNGYLNLALGSATARQVVSGEYNFSPADLAYIANHDIHMDHDQAVTASFGASYPVWGTRLGFDALYGSGLRNGPYNTTSLPPYTQVNLGASRTFSLPTLGQFDGRVAVLNVLDYAYQLRDTTGIGVNAPLYGPRRAYYVGISKPF